MCIVWQCVYKNISTLQLTFEQYHNNSIIITACSYPLLQHSGLVDQLPLPTEAATHFVFKLLIEVH